MESRREPYDPLTHLNKSKEAVVAHALLALQVETFGQLLALGGAIIAEHKSAATVVKCVCEIKVIENVCK
jgi:hypothetical protein